MLGYKTFFGKEVSPYEHLKEMVNDGITDIFMTEYQVGEKDYKKYEIIKPRVTEAIRVSIEDATKKGFTDFNSGDVYEFLMNKFVNSDYRMGLIVEILYHYLPKIDLNLNESIISYAKFKKDLH